MPTRQETADRIAREIVREATGAYNAIVDPARMERDAAIEPYFQAQSTAGRVIIRWRQERLLEAYYALEDRRGKTPLPDDAYDAERDEIGRAYDDFFDEVDAAYDEFTRPIEEAYAAKVQEARGALIRAQAVADEIARGARPVPTS